MKLQLKGFIKGSTGDLDKRTVVSVPSQNGAVLWLKGEREGGGHGFNKLDHYLA